MIRDEQLEVISDKIRMGTPVGFFEAIAAINYQEARKRFARENVWWRRAIRRIKGAAHPAQAGGVSK